MAIRGKGYIKTSWAFQERPVASAKLNTWDGRIAAAFELLVYHASMAWSAADGVPRNAATGDLGVVAASTTAMAVAVQPGDAIINRFPFRLEAPASLGGIAAPAAYPRIDLVQARLDTWYVTIKPGAESASPSPRAPDTACLALAELYLRPGMTGVLDADDGVNGYIRDVRTYV